MSEILAYKTSTLTDGYTNQEPQYGCGVFYKSTRHGRSRSSKAHYYPEGSTVGRKDFMEPIVASAITGVNGLPI